MFGDASLVLTAALAIAAIAMQAAPANDATIDALTRLIEKTPANSPGRSDLQYQLAELYWERAKDLRGKEGVDSPEPRKSTAYAQEAVRQYKKIVDGSQDYPRRDEVLYSMASALVVLENPAEAAQRLKQLLAEYPQSKLRPDALLILGEQAFTQEKDNARARTYFERARVAGSPRVRWFSTYRLAWTDINSGDPKGAKAKLESIVDAADGGDAIAADLRQQALADLVRIYAQLDRSADGLEYFRTRGGADASRLIERFGRTLFDAGKFEDAVRVFKEFIAANPQSPAALRLRILLAKAYEARGQREAELEELRRISDLRLPNSELAKALKPADFENARNEIEGALIEFATNTHQEGVKTKRKQSLEMAQSIYALFEKTPPSDPGRAIQVAYYLGEIAWGFQDYRRAADSYARVNGISLPKDDNVAADLYRRAAYNRVLALAKLREAQGAQANRAALDKEFLEASDFYLKAFPNDDDAKQLRAETVILRAQNSDEGRKALREFVEKHPKTPEAKEGGEALMEMLEKNGSWEELAKLAGAWRAQGTLGDDQATSLQRIEYGARFKYLDEVVIRQKRDLVRGREGMLALATIEAPFADRALAYAVATSIELKESQRVIELAQTFLKHFPGSPFAARVRYQLMTTQAKRGEEGAAAQTATEYGANRTHMLQVSKEGGDDAATRQRWLKEAILSAGPWSELSGDLARAVEAYRFALSAYPKEPENAGVAFHNAELLRELKRPQDASKAFDGFVRTYGRSDPLRALEARVAIAELSAPKAQPALARAILRAQAALKASDRASPAATAAAAKAQWMLLRAEYEAYDRLKVLSITSRDRALQKKQAALKSLVDRTSKLLELGDAQVALDALVQLGDAYASFARALAAMPPLARLDENQNAMFRAELETTYILPLEEKATEAYAAVIQKANELHLYGDALVAARREISKIAPGKTPTAISRELLASRVGDDADAQHVAAAHDALGRGEEAAPLRRTLIRAALLKGDLMRARALCGLELREHPQVAELWSTCGAVANAREDRTAAMHAFLQAIQLSPNTPEFLHDAGTVALGAGAAETAEDYFGRAVKLAPSVYDWRFAYAQALDAQRTSRPETTRAAGEAYEAAAKLTREKGPAVCGAAWAYSTASATWTRAIDLFTSCTTATTDSTERERIATKVQTIQAALRTSQSSRQNGGAPEEKGSKP